MKIHIIIPALSCLATASPAHASPARAAGENVCRPGETMIFACGIGRKVAALCQGRAGSSSASVQYRFGLSGKPEFVYPEDHDSRSNAISYAFIPSAAGGESQIIFSNRGFTYILYDKMWRTNYGPSGRHDSAFEAGILVQRHNRIISRQICDDHYELHLSSNLAERVLGQADSIDH